MHRYSDKTSNIIQRVGCLCFPFPFPFTISLSLFFFFFQFNAIAGHEHTAVFASPFSPCSAILFFARYSPSNHQEVFILLQSGIFHLSVIFRSKHLLSPLHSSVVCGGSQVEISARRQTILTVFFSGFP